MRAASGTCAVLCLVGIAVRLTVRDRVPALAAIDYALPPIVLAGLAFIAAFLFSIRRRRNRAFAAAVVAAGCLFWSYRTAFVQNAVSPAATAPADGPAVRVLFWNVCRGWFGWSNIVDELRRNEAAIIGLAEAYRDGDARLAWKQDFPDYRIADLGRGMVILARGPIKRLDKGKLGDGGVYAVVEVALENQALAVVLADFKSNPILPRRKTIMALAAVLDRYGDRPVVLMGDFNTPADSVHFSLLRPDFHNAFETAGHGYTATWPVPLPVIAIDQVWVNERVDIRDCRLHWSWRSDHRPVVTELGIRQLVDDAARSAIP